jgi:hypothetical protein
VLLIKCSHFFLVDPCVHTKQCPAQGINHSLPLVLATSSVQASRTSSLCCLSARWRVPRVDFSCFQSHQVAISRVDFPCLSALAVWFLLVSQSSRSWIPEPQVPDFFLPRADFWCKSSIPARVPWICPSVRFWRSVRSFVLPPKEWLPAIAMPDLDFQVLLLLTHA